jgi:exo-beta-1,3-glucanase (GH17 family)
MNTPAHIDQLLDVLMTQTNFNCLGIYSLSGGKLERANLISPLLPIATNLCLNHIIGKEYILQSAKRRGLKVLATVWLDTDPTLAARNNQNVQDMIQVAISGTYDDTLIAIACGSEIKARQDATKADGLITGCIDSLRNAGVQQPLGSRDVWAAWCNWASPCQRWAGIVDKIDFVGVNVFSYWDNIYSKDDTNCIPFDQGSAQYNVAMYNNVKGAYSDKFTFISEFGWPNGGDDPTPRSCNTLSPLAQQDVLQQSYQMFIAQQIPAILFQSFSLSYP